MKPRSGWAKGGETAGDLAILGSGVTLAFAIFRTRYDVDPMLENATMAFVMSLGGALSRAIRSRMRYGA